MSRILKILEQFDDNVTVGQLIKKIKGDQKETSLKEEYNFNKVKEEYKDSYLKFLDPDALFGKTLNVYHIEEVTSKEKTTDWDLYYRVKGSKLEFTPREVFERSMNGTDINYSFSETQLREMIKISKEDFKYYINQYCEIKDKLAKIIE